MSTVRKNLFSITMIFVIALACVSIVQFGTAQTAYAANEGEYDLWVGGVQVKDANKTDIFKDGTASYDPESNTLLLNNATITKAYTETVSPFKLKYLIYTDIKGLTISGNATLSDNGEDINFGIGSSNDLTIRNATLNISVLQDGAGIFVASDSEEGNIKIINSYVTVESKLLGIYSYRESVEIDEDSVVTVNSGNDAVCAYEKNVVINGIVEATSQDASGIFAGQEVSFGTGGDVIASNNSSKEDTIHAEKNKRLKGMNRSSSEETELDLNLKTDLNEVPRFGMRFPLIEDFENIQYFGKGDRECYIDYQEHAKMGVWTSTVTSEYEPYIRPQDCGNHINVKYLNVSDAENFIRFLSDDPFEFSALHYTIEELDRKEHSFELEPSHSSEILICYKNRGVGSASCGPALSDKYRVTDKVIGFSFDIMGTTGGG